MTINALRLSFVVTENILDLQRGTGPAMPLGSLVNEPGYINIVNIVQRGGAAPNQLQMPWPHRAGNHFWDAYLQDKLPGDAGGKLCFEKLVPLRLPRFVEKIEMVLPEPGPTSMRLGIEGFYYPYGTGLLVTAALNWQHLAWWCLPLLVLAGGVAVWLWRRSPMIGRYGLVCLLAGELFFLGVRTRAQTLVWHDDESLWRGVLAQFPNSDQANEMLAQALLNENRIPEALTCAQHAVEVAPSAETRRNLGIVLTQAGETQEAVGEFKLALQLNPGMADTHCRLGIVLQREGKLEEAIAHYQQALRTNPNYAEAYSNLGNSLQSLKRFEEYSAPQLLYKRLDRDFGYITFNGFWPETAAEFERAIKALHDTRGLVIDLRDNGGGAAFSAAQMASYLFSKQTSLGQFVSRSGDVTEPKTQPVDKLMYAGQVMILISEQSGSGAEVFAATLQEQGRVSVIGHPSCGCVLGINRRHILPDGGALDVSEVDYHTSKGTRLEGVGVIPNTVTDLHISDLLSGRDTAMEMALSKLRQIVYAGVTPPSGQ